MEGELIFAVFAPVLKWGSKQKVRRHCRPFGGVNMPGNRSFAGRTVYEASPDFEG
jgi:hypothetical protein